MKSKRIEKMQTEESYLCPVCGYIGLREPPYMDNIYSSFEICPCCNTEFGFDDAYPNKTLVEAWVELREKWLKRGGEWQYPDEKPKGWNLKDALKNIRKFEEKFKKEGKSDFRAE